MMERYVRAEAAIVDWEAEEARHRFAELVDKAVGGEPQFIRRRDGREVVMVSREYFEKTRRNLKNYLIGTGYAGEEDDAFDVAMKTVREGPPLFGPLPNLGHPALNRD